MSIRKNFYGWWINCKTKEIKDTFNALIITPAPTETIPQFTDDLFDKFIDFKFYACAKI